MNRVQIRNLLRPGIRQCEGDRGIPFTVEEENYVVDAYVQGMRSGLGSGPDAASRAMKALVARPLVIAQHQAGLARLRSVSPAYRQAQIPKHLRKDASHDGRRSTQKAARRTPQAPDPRWHGGAQSVAGTVAGGGGASGSPPPYGYFTTTINGPLHFYGNQYLSQQSAMMAYQQMAAMANQNAVYPGGMTQFGQSLLAGTLKPLPTEIKAGEIVAWRCWRRVGGRLLSMTQPTEWEVGKPLEAPSGQLDDGLGIHAWKTEAQARNYGGSPSFGESIVIGTVELWGEVIEHSEGYRAQFAEIKDLVDGIAFTPAQYTPVRTSYAQAISDVLASLTMEEIVGGAIASLMIASGIVGLLILIS